MYLFGLFIFQKICECIKVVNCVEHFNNRKFSLQQDTSNVGSRSSSGSGEMYPDSMTSLTGEGDRGQQPDQSRSPLICSGTEPVSPAGERSSVKYWGWEIIGLSFHITCTTVLVPKISVACTCCFSDVPGFKTFQMALKPLLL